MSRFLRPRVPGLALASAGAALVLTMTALTPAIAAPADPAVPVTELTYSGEAGGALGFGASRTSCDINGDGFADIIVGDQNWNRGANKAVGASYALLGSANTIAGDVSSFEKSRAIRFDGPDVTVLAGAWTGWSVSCLSDVNGDGIDDIAIGVGSRNYHRVHIVFGSREIADVDLDVLGTRGFVIENSGAQDKTTLDGATDNFGFWVGRVGDVNGDGLADIGIADVAADLEGRFNNGRVWIISGSASVKNMDVATDTSRVLRTIDGAAANDRLGNVEAVGDVNGDGIDDVVVGAYTGTPWGSAVAAPGVAYVVYGVAGTTTIATDLADLGEAGFPIYGGMRQRDRLGISIAAAGDVNRDGYADFLLGADGVDNATTGLRNGGVAVVYGSASGAPVMTAPSDRGYSVFQCADGDLDTTCATSHKVSRGYWINGPTASGKLGYSVASLPDVNGDGIPDFILGQQNRGTWLVFGDPKITKTQDLATATTAQAVRLGTTQGQAVGNAGDVDGNGVADIFSGGSNTGKLYLLGALNTAVTVDAPESATIGAKATITAHVSAAVPSAASQLAGTVALSVNGSAIAGCEALPVTGAGSVECTAVVDTIAGTAAITAHFRPDTGRFKPATAQTTMSVAKAKSWISEPTLSQRSAVFGTGGISVTTTVAKSATGAVEFTEGNRVLGTATIGAQGAATFTLPKDLSAGEHHISARYTGSDRFLASSRVLAAESVTITRAKSSVATPVLSVRTTPYDRFAVMVSAKVSSTEAGTVTFQTGKKQLGKVAVSAQGTAKLSLPKNQAIGSYPITANFTGTGNISASAASAPVTLTIVKASLAATIKASAPAVKKKGSPVVTVNLGKLNSGAFPTGKVSVSAAGKTATVTVTAAQKGVVKVQLGTKISRNTTVTAQYLGSATAHAGAKVSFTAKVK